MIKYALSWLCKLSELLQRIVLPYQEKNDYPAPFFIRCSAVLTFKIHNPHSPHCEPMRQLNPGDWTYLFDFQIFHFYPSACIGFSIGRYCIHQRESDNAKWMGDLAPFSIPAIGNTQSSHFSEFMFDEESVVDVTCPGI